MSREEIVNNIGYQLTRAAVDYVEKHEFADSMDCFEAGAEWMQEKMRETNEGQALLYTVEKTAERTKREMIKKAAEWLSNNMFNSINNGVIINGYCVSDFIGRFKKAMQDEQH